MQDFTDTRPTGLYEAAVGRRTMCQHVDVPQQDGSIARFHCRVVVPNDGVQEVQRTPGWLERTWRKFFPDRRTEEEILFDKLKWLRMPD